MKPILSRFCEIYVPEPEHKGKTINLYRYNLDETFKLTSVKTTRSEWLKKEIQKTVSPKITETELITFVIKLYEKGYSALDLIKLLEDGYSIKEISIDDNKKYELLVAFNKVRKEFRNEKILMLFILNFTFLNIDVNLENISFM